MTREGVRRAVRASIEQISELGVVPVVELTELGQAVPLFEALCAGGLPIAEITLRTPVALDAIKGLTDAYPDALIGAGTVRSLDGAKHALAAGARFVVSPGTDLDVLSFCSDQGVLVLPGVCTPTEIQTAVKSGADLLKFFPAEPMGGVAYLKALAGAFPEVRFVPTGGVNAENLAEYLKLPQVVACGGSWMVARSLLREGDFGRVKELVAAAVSRAAQLRHGI